MTIKGRMPEESLLHCVIGSGPAGVACAHALLERGAEVMMLDAGLSLEPERAALVAAMRQTTPAAWTPEQIARIKEGTSATAKGLPLKLLYGSDFPYRDCDESLGTEYDGVGVRASFAKGGLSTVWGAAMLPYAQRDVAEWPISLAELNEHYAAVAGLAGLSAKSDDLENLFPLFQSNPAALDLSSQAKILLGRLEQNRGALSEAGIRFGQARRAVKLSRRPHTAGCVYCGLCMYGCPYGFIYNSETTLEQLQTRPGFTYRPGVIVTSLRENSGSIAIEGYQSRSREPFKMEARRAYLAAGIVPSTQILMRSMSLYDQAVSMKDSQYFLVPLALTRSAGDVTREALHTLSQLFVEIFDPKISPRTVHLQIYSYSDLIGQAIRGSFGPLAKPLEALARGLERRLLIVQGFLHSDDSAQITTTLTRAGKGPGGRLKLQARVTPESKKIIGRVIRKLFLHGRQFGAYPIRPMLQIADPGRGIHSGGAFPMSARPGPLQTDTLGRPRGWQRLHVVDATVLPSIPATTITFSVMANAHRIAWNSTGLD
jgi:choline dehydrogenase-like flavoprotein